MLPIKLSFLLSYFILLRSLKAYEINLDEDKNYDIINFKVPQDILLQALKPTPVLKSPATVTVPIHVTQDELDEFDADDELQEPAIANIETDVSTINENVVQEVSQDVVAAQVTDAPAIQNDETSPATENPVSGQVFRFPCSCVGGQCGCCTGTILERIRMKTCGNITFVPEDFVFDVRLTVNNNTMVRRRVSASDPPPICFNPRRAPFVRVCAEISNIRIRNRNAFACLDISADIGGFPVYLASFRCFGLGASGVQTGLNPKPVSSGPSPVSLFGVNNNDDDDRDGFFGGGGGEGGGIFGSPGGGLFGGDSDDDGPLDVIGDAVDDLFDGRKLDLPF